MFLRFVCVPCFDDSLCTYSVFFLVCPRFLSVCFFYDAMYFCVSVILRVCVCVCLCVFVCVRVCVCVLVCVFVCFVRRGVVCGGGSALCVCVFVFLCYMFSYFDNSVCYAFCVLVFVVFLRFSSLCVLWFCDTMFFVCL